MNTPLPATRPMALLPVFLSTIAALVVGTSSGHANETGDKLEKPNILWLTIEDTSMFFGCYGDKVAKTPNIDRLAQQGTRFTRAFASSPVCSAARSALITGMHVGALGVGNHRSIVDIPKSIKGYPHYLRKAGYYCTNHTKNDFNFTTARSFSEQCWDDNTKEAHWRGRAVDQPFFSIFNFNDSHQSRTSVNSYARFQKNIQSQLSPAEITSPDEVDLPPFYHDSPRMREAYARVYDCVTLVDRQIGERLQQLEDDGLADDTIVIFFSDHGQGIPRFKTFPFALGYRVPMIVRVPEKFRHLLPLEPGTVCDDLVSFVDLGPTMLRLVGETEPPEMTGMPLWGAGGKPTQTKEYFYGSLNDVGAAENHSRTVCDGRYAYIRNYMPHLPYCQPQLYCDSSEIMRFIREDHNAGILKGPAARLMADARPAEALYDLEQDPWEINNLAGDPMHRPKLEELRSVNRDKILDIRDLHFLHPWEIETRGGGKPAASIRDDKTVFPLKRILAVAEKCGMGSEVLDTQLAALRNSEPMCRYWALIGLHSQDLGSPAILAAVEPLLDDPAPYVRYEAASICCNYDAKSRQNALQVLVDGIQEPHSILVDHAMRKIALLGKRAAGLLDAVNSVEKSIPKLADQKQASPVRNSIKTYRLRLEGKAPESQDQY